MVYSEAGLVARQCWKDIPLHFPNVVLHAFLIMPDHVHGLIEIVRDDGVKYTRQRNYHESVVRTPLALSACPRASPRPLRALRLGLGGCRLRGWLRLG